MERRAADRQLTRTRVTIHHRSDKGAVQSKTLATRDMSASGVFVVTAAAEMEGSTQPNKGELIDMTFAIDLGAVTKLHKVRGVVAYTTPSGLGVQFVQTP